MYTGQAPHPGKHVCPKHICRHGQPFATYFIFLEASVEPGTLVVSAAAFAFWYSCEMGASPVVSCALSSVLCFMSEYIPPLLPPWSLSTPALVYNTFRCKRHWQGEVQDRRLHL